MSVPRHLTEVAEVARTLLLDRAAGAAASHLADGGVLSILLKGPAIATWLYEDGAIRLYRDVDLLVARSQFARAIELLAGIGYSDVWSGADPAEISPKERELVGPGNVCIDLHHGLLGTGNEGDELWDRLWQHTTTLVLAGPVEVRVLDEPARAMHLALHVAQNGPMDQKALNDLGRGLAKVEQQCWKEAAELAADLDATEAFGAGLRLLPDGALLADGLGLPQTMSVELILRTRSDTQDAIFFERLSTAPGIRAKASLLARKVYPTDVYLRGTSPLAARGSFGLTLARVGRPFALIGRFPPAFVAWRRARRARARQLDIRDGKSY